MKYNCLTVLSEPVSVRKHKSVRKCVDCKCECGSIVFNVPITYLKNGRVKSCGCGISRSLKGLSRHPLYWVWNNMISRCHNHKDVAYGRYGARGITVCKEWNDFLAFYSDMICEWSKGLEIDRIDNRKGYKKSNCRWVTKRYNMCNTRKSKIWHVLGIDFPSQNIAGEYYGVSGQTIQAWCEGRNANGKFYPPKKGCHSERKYK